MKRKLITALVAAVTIMVFSTSVLAVDFGFGLINGQPGFYGRIDTGGIPQPPVIYPQPIAIEQVLIDRPPVYLRVPTGHAKNWKKYCRQYQACGERVYFVQNNWYKYEYVPRYQEQHRDHQNDDHGKQGNNKNSQHKNGKKQGHGGER